MDKASSVLENAELTGLRLRDVVAQHPVEILGKAVADKYNNQLPLLAKFIEAKLSGSSQR